MIFLNCSHIFHQYNRRKKFEITVTPWLNIVVVVLTILFSCIGMIYNYRTWMNVFGMSSMPWQSIIQHWMIEPHPSELTHYYLTLHYVWQVSYLINPNLWNIIVRRSRESRLEPSSHRTASERPNHSPTELY